MEDKKEKSKSGIVLIVVLLLIAICGVCFGVFEMMQVNKKDSKIADLEKKVSTQANNNKDNNTTTDLVSSGGPYIKDNYFYVPEWDYKFKIPEDLTSIGFSVDYDEAHVGYDLPFSGVTGVLKSDISSGAQAQYYDDILNCSIISVNKTKKGNNNYSLGSYDKEIDGYVLRISDHTSNYCNFKLHKDEVVSKLVNMFQNPEPIK